jgi:CubicO group peptidase (beta-lactamase class C family)
MGEAKLTKIDRPLNISDGVYRRSPEYLKEQVNLVYPEIQPDGSTRFKPTAFTLPINPVTCGGGGGLHISAGSFIKLLQTLLNGGVYAPTGNRILQQETIDLFFTPQYTNDAGAKFGDQVKNWLHLNRDPFHRSKDNGGANASEVPHRKRGWGLGCGLNLEDLEGGRGTGTLWASGFG